jgi:hypothetical protein
MRFSKNKWLAYTLLVGLIPILTRLAAWLTTKAGVVSAVAAPDFIAFGLVLHVSTVNEIEHLPAKYKEWKSLHNGASLVFVAVYSTLYALTILAERNAFLVDANTMLHSCMAVAIVSSMLSLSAFLRLAKWRV